MQLRVLSPKNSDFIIVDSRTRKINEGDIFDKKEYIYKEGIEVPSLEFAMNWLDQEIPKKEQKHYSIYQSIKL